MITKNEIVQNVSFICFLRSFKVVMKYLYGWRMKTFSGGGLTEIQNI